MCGFSFHKVWWFIHFVSQNVSALHPDRSSSLFLFIVSTFRMNLSVVSNGSSPTKQMCSKPEWGKSSITGCRAFTQKNTSQLHNVFLRPYFFNMRKCSALENFTISKNGKKKLKKGFFQVTVCPERNVWLHFVSLRLRGAAASKTSAFPQDFRTGPIPLD